MNGSPPAGLAGLAGRAKAWLRALRVTHWSKNMLVYVAAIGAHQMGSAAAVGDVTLAFAIFCLLASAAYLFNDVIDIDADRRHPQKRLRPIAAGEISRPAAVAASMLLAGSAAAASLLLPAGFQAVAAAYFVITLAYSLLLKRLLIIDISVLSVLFALRVFAGSTAIEVEVSFWLLIFSVFIFLSLALFKRYAETLTLEGADEMPGRAYRAADAPALAMLGCVCGMNAVLVLGLYIDSEVVADRYSSPIHVWLVLPIVLFWIARIWILGGRRQLADDPLAFAARDPASWICLILFLALVYLAI